MKMLWCSYLPCPHSRVAMTKKLTSRFLLDPFAYTILVLPLSITRWAVLDRSSSQPTAQIPFAASGISLFLFGLSGLVNVILFRVTRPNILLFMHSRERSMSGSGSRQNGAVAQISSTRSSMREPKQVEIIDLAQRGRGSPSMSKMAEMLEASEEEGTTSDPTMHRALPPPTPPPAARRSDAEAAHFQQVRRPSAPLYPPSSPSHTPLSLPTPDGLSPSYPPYRRNNDI